jgi:hypothetical protein
MVELIYDDILKNGPISMKSITEKHAPAEREARRHHLHHPSDNSKASSPPPPSSSSLQVSTMTSNSRGPHQSHTAAAHEWLKDAVPQLDREYAWWMRDGKHALTFNSDGQAYTLNRYFAEATLPRPESFWKVSILSYS